MELDYKAIGKRIKIARIKADLTQEALAEKASLSTHEQHRNRQLQIEFADDCIFGKCPFRFC